MNSINNLKFDFLKKLAKNNCTIKIFMIYLRSVKDL